MSTTISLKDKTAIVTGGGRGIGKAITPVRRSGSGRRHLLSVVGNDWSGWQLMNSWSIWRHLPSDWK